MHWKKKPNIDVEDRTKENTSQHISRGELFGRVQARRMTTSIWKDMDIQYAFFGETDMLLEKRTFYLVGEALDGCVCSQ